MLIPALKLKAKKVNDETREFLSKDGVSKVKRRVVNISALDADGDFIKITAFDPSFPVPKDGQEFTLPPVRRFECYDGLVQNVTV